MNGLNPIYLTENNVSINGHESSLVSVLYGVLQGSVLGPLLFLTPIILLMTLICFTSINLFVVVQCRSGVILVYGL